MAIELEINQGPSTGRRVALQGFELTLGRDAQCVLVIAEREVSRLHAKLSLRNGLWHVQDMGSANGTRVNGAQIGTAPVPLNLGDVIQLGPVTLRLQDPAMSDQPASHGAAPQQPLYQLPPAGAAGAPFGKRETSGRHEHAGASASPVASLFDPSSPWRLIALVALACLVLMCLGAFALTILPYLLIVGGLVCGCVGVSLYRRFHGHAGWQQQASKGLAMAVGGFAAAALGFIILTSALWSLAGPGGFQPGDSPPAQAPPSTSGGAGQRPAQETNRSAGNTESSPAASNFQPPPSGDSAPPPPPVDKRGGGSPASRPIGESVNRREGV